MEVHHHPDLHQKRKKFREYLLEFVMIFLAVTLGFFAENGVQTWTSFKQVFDGTLANDFFTSYKETGKIPSDLNVLISKDQEKISLLRNNYWTFAGTVNAYNAILVEQRQWLQSFVVFLKLQYDLQ